VIEFVRRYTARSSARSKVSKVFFDMMSILRKFRVRANPEFTLVNIAIAVTEGIAQAVGIRSGPDVRRVAVFFAKLNFVG